MYFYNKTYNHMWNWIAEKLTQGFGSFAGEKLSQGYNYARNSLNYFFLLKNQAIKQAVVTLKGKI